MVDSSIPPVKPNRKGSQYCRRLKFMEEPGLFLRRHSREFVQSRGTDPDWKPFLCSSFDNGGQRRLLLEKQTRLMHDYADYVNFSSCAHVRLLSVSAREWHWVSFK